MLDKPDLPDEKIETFLQDAYGLAAAQVEFLPLGADVHVAVYRVETGGGPYFLKLRRGAINELSVLMPWLFSQRGIPHILPPLPGQAGRLWMALEDYQAILYPFVAGKDAYEVDLTDRQWKEFGAALRQIHELPLPAEVYRRLRRESFAPHGRERVRGYLAQLEERQPVDAIEADLTMFLLEKRTEISALVARTEVLAQALQANPPDFIFCHADLHAGNLLISGPERFYLVDWDDVILAPRERDLMSVGGGLMGGWRTPKDEETLFYAGYGAVRIDPVALAYYRYERIVQDLAVECRHIYQSKGDDQNRQQELVYLKSNFQPNSVLAIARAGDQAPRKR